MILIRRNWNHIFNGPSRQSRGATATLTSVFRSHQPSLLPHTSPESLGSHPCWQPSLSGSQLETVTTVKQGRCPRIAAQREDLKDGSRIKRKAPETGTPRGQSWERGADCPRPGEAAAAAGPAPEDGGGARSRPLSGRRLPAWSGEEPGERDAPTRSSLLPALPQPPPIGCAAQKPERRPQSASGGGG